MLLTARDKWVSATQNTEIHEAHVSEIDNCWPEDNSFRSGESLQHMHTPAW